MIVGKQIPMYLKFTLRSLRIRADLTQSEAALKLGVTADTLRRWEKDSGNLDITTIDKICELYSIPRDYIFFGSDDALSVILKTEKEKEAI
ncbi:helix-turn-helix domain-containing protein [Sporolactobacillus sp. KGMB 08714]|uniref:helix-turn-helix domain-containing protein n=1 Tax=Sporolactobacillus sp. KGMB 08714 TaxID=3064704 RepID=UPI002FBE202C